MYGHKVNNNREFLISKYMKDKDMTRKEASDQVRKHYEISKKFVEKYKKKNKKATEDDLNNVFKEKFHEQMMKEEYQEEERKLNKNSKKKHFK